MREVKKKLGDGVFLCKDFAYMEYVKILFAEYK